MIGLFILSLFLSSSLALNFLKIPAIDSRLVDHVNSVQSSWVAHENPRFSKMTLAEAKSLMGTFLNDTNKPPAKVKIQSAEKISLPESFDSRDAWPLCSSIREIRDQSNCGSCWAFGAVTAMSDRICIKSNQTRQDRLSAEDLISCCGYFICGMGCHGGLPSGAWSYWVTWGISTGGLYGTNGSCKPYSLPPCDHGSSGRYQPCQRDLASTPLCTSECQAEYSTLYNDDLRFGVNSYSVPEDEESIKNEIFQNGPVEAAFYVYEDFLAYKSGVYSYVTGSYLGGHAIRILGWGVENSIPYWLIANSWNEDWGDKGLFKIKRGSNECGIEGYIMAGVPQL